MNIDDAVKHIEEQKEIFSGTHGEFLDNVLEWLDELKFLRRWKSGVVEDFCKYDASSIDEIARNARKKAINDFAEKISTYGTYDHYGNTIDVLEIAEQMKNCD